MFKNKFGKRNSKGYEDIQYSCKIRFLDDSEPITVTFQKETKGQWLLDLVCKELNLVEKAYFGLRYVDSEKQRHWLDPLKPVYRQLKHVNPMVLCFRVKFYPTDPMKLKEEITRYFLFLQLRRDLHHGRLLCSPQDANLLAAYIIQSEVGDYDPEDHPPGYVAQFKMLPKQTAKQEDKIAEIHKSLTQEGGCSVPAEAEAAFLKKASTLDTYGVDPHPVKDQKGNQMYLGVTHLGIVTFQGNKRTHLFKWPQINKIAFEGKMFIVHVTINEKKHACGFKCPTFNACKHLWKCAVEQQYFFTLGQSSEAPKVTSSGGWFTRGSKFRFSGRCQKEVYNESAGIQRDPPQFERSLSNPQFVRSFNKLRCASMPIKFRDKSQDIGDVIENNQHGSSATLPNMTRSHEMQDISLDNVDGTIPEERAVTLSEVPYQPLDSPQEEDLPKFPPDDVFPPFDLDSQIHELQNELDRCRITAEEVDTVFDPALIEQQEREVIEEEIKPVNPGARLEATEAPKPEENHGHKGNKAECVPQERTREETKPGVIRLTAIASVLLILMLIVLFILVLETDLALPVVKTIREFPSVHAFRHNNYNPFKNSMTQCVGSLFKA